MIALAEERRSTTGATSSLYDHAYVLLALARLPKASGDRPDRDHIHELIDAIDMTLACRVGGWAEDEQGSLPRRQKSAHAFIRGLPGALETGHENR